MKYFGRPRQAPQTRNAGDENRKRLSLMSRGCLSGRACLAVSVTVLAVLSAGCCPCRRIAASQQDSVRIVSDVRTVERLVRDTVWVEVPDQRERVVVRDTLSRLENDWAWSVAVMTSGVLRHELATKPGRRPVAADCREVITVRTDTVCIDRVRSDVVEVARPLTWWQQTQIRGFRLLLVLAGAWLLWKRVF